ncbi:MAG TPA: hypothetical protein VF272_00305 [Candidatus Saccharimonadia bacterium]
MQDQPQGGDAREDQDIQLEFYEQLGHDDQARLSEEMGYIENETDVDTFGETLGDSAAEGAADPFMAEEKEDLS